jgi:hypothetical protein
MGYVVEFPRIVVGTLGIVQTKRKGVLEKRLGKKEGNSEESPQRMISPPRNETRSI